MSDLRSEIPEEDLTEFRSFGLELAVSARKITLTTFRSHFEIEQKSDRSFVTAADLETEERLREIISERFPEHGIIGEEFERVNPEAELQWVLDPIDGTEEFAARMPTWGTIIGLFYKERPIFGVIDHPALDVCTHGSFRSGCYSNGRAVSLSQRPFISTPGAERVFVTAPVNFLKFSDETALFEKIAKEFPNLRIVRSCYAHSCALLGQADAMFEYNVNLWDLAATELLMEEAGGVYKTIKAPNDDWTAGPYGAVFGIESVVKRLVELAE